MVISRGRGPGQQRINGGFALPMLLVSLTVAGIAATTAQVALGYRQAREREEELHFRGEAYVAAIRSFYIADEQPQRRRLPTSLEELEKDPRFPLKRHIRRLYDDPLKRKPVPFRVITGAVTAGQPQGIIGVASTADSKLYRRTGFNSNAGPTLGIKNARDLLFQVNLKELVEASQPLLPGRPVRPVTPTQPGSATPAKPSVVK